jgi:adenosylcobinamide-GDP ribazoletransferase
MISRWALVFSIFSFPYARQEGKAKIFFQAMNGKIFILATAMTLAFAFSIWLLRGLWVMFVTSTCVYLIGRFINKRLQGITGDTLGAVNEFSEVMILLCILL